MFPNPAILTHPNIPKPLHSVNPRSIKGDEWWNKVRQDAYAVNNYCCWACGVHKSKALFHQWLEAHEYYDIDYANGLVTLKEITALCHACHNFIHSGRLWVMFQRGQVDREKITTILEHGFNILERNKLKPFVGTLTIDYLLAGFPKEGAQRMARLTVGYQEQVVVAPWEEWHLQFEGKDYYSPFKNIEEWADFYK